MNKIILNNLKRADAINLLEMVQKNHCPSAGIQGGEKCRFISVNQVTATVTPTETDNGIDFSKNTFEISSNYFMKATLAQIIEQ